LQEIKISEFIENVSIFNFALEETKHNVVLKRELFGTTFRLIWLYMSREGLPNIAAIDPFSPSATMVNGLAEASFKDIPEIFEVHYFLIVAVDLSNCRYSESG
jgi:hypothetical protein